MAKAETYVFLLAVLLIAAAYYIGVTTDAKTAFTGANTLLQTVTGRNSDGAFARYPIGA